MKLRIFLLLAFLILGSIGGYFYFNRVSGATFGQIKAGMKLGTYHQIESGDNKVVVGDKDGKSFASKVELSKWDDEVKFNISYPTDKNTKPIAEDNKITWKDKDKEVYFKKLEVPQPPKQELKVKDEGKIRYIKYGSTDLATLAASYELNTKMGSLTPTQLFCQTRTLMFFLAIDMLRLT